MYRITSPRICWTNRVSPICWYKPLLRAHGCISNVTFPKYISAQPLLRTGKFACITTRFLMDHGRSTQAMVRQNASAYFSRISDFQSRKITTAGSGASNAGLTSADSPHNAPAAVHCRIDVARSDTSRQRDSMRAESDVSHNNNVIITVSGHNAQSQAATQPTVSVRYSRPSL